MMNPRTQRKIVAALAILLGVSLVVSLVVPFLW
jgi:hypothetical protein